MLRTTSMLEEAMNPPVLAIIKTLQTKFPAYHLKWKILLGTGTEANPPNYKYF